MKLTADGRVIAMTLEGSQTGVRNSENLFQLKVYAKRLG